MAVGREDVEILVKAHPERIHLPVGKMLDAAAVELEAKSVARLHMDFIPVAAFHAAVIVEAMARIDPAIPAAAKTIDHAMRIAAGIKRAIENRSLVTDAVAVGVFEMPDVRNAVSDAAALPRKIGRASCRERV